MSNFRAAYRRNPRVYRAANAAACCLARAFPHSFLSSCYARLANLPSPDARRNDNDNVARREDRRYLDGKAYVAGFRHSISK